MSFVAFAVTVLTAVLAALLVYISLRVTLRAQEHRIASLTSEAETSRIFRAGIDRSPYAIGFFTSEGHWLHANAKLLQLLGIRRDQLAKFSMRALTHPEDRKKEARLLADLRTGKTVAYSINKRLQRGNGEYADYQVDVIRCSEQGAVQAFQCIVSEIESGDRANDLIQALDDFGDVAIVRIDTHGKIAGWSRGAEQLYGLRGEDAIGRVWSRLRSDSTNGQSEASQQLAAAARDRLLAATELRFHNDGSRINVTYTILPLLRGKELAGFVEIARDATVSGSATQYRRAYEKLKATSDERMASLADANREMREDLARQEQEIEALQETVNALRADEGAPPAGEPELIIEEEPEHSQSAVAIPLSDGSPESVAGQTPADLPAGTPALLELPFVARRGLKGKKKKAHRSDCSSAREIDEPARIHFDSKEAAVAAGYTLCRRCSGQGRRR